MEKSTNQKTKNKKLSSKQLKRYNFCIEYINKNYKFLKRLKAKDGEILISALDSKSIEERQAIVDDLKIYLLNFFHYFALQFAKSNLKLEDFEDLINEYYLKTIDILNELVIDPKRFSSYLSYRSTILTCGLTLLNKAVGDNLTFKSKREPKYRGKKVQLESLSDEVVDPSEPFEDRLLEKYIFDPQKGYFYKMLKKLSPREIKVVKMYYGLDGEKQRNLEEIGEYYNLSSKTIDSILVKAIIKIKNSIYKGRRLNDLIETKDRPYHQTDASKNASKNSTVEYTGGDEEIVDYEKFSSKEAYSDSDYTYFDGIDDEEEFSDSDNEVTYNNDIRRELFDKSCTYCAGDEEIVNEESFANATGDDKVEVNINTETMPVNTSQVSQEENENLIKKMKKPYSNKDKKVKPNTLVNELIKNGNPVINGLNNLK